MWKKEEEIKSGSSCTNCQLKINKYINKYNTLTQIAAKVGQNQGCQAEQLPAWFNSGCFVHLCFAWKPFYDLNFCLHGCLKNVCVNTSTFICLVNMWSFVICSHQITESEQHHCQMPITEHKKQIIKMDRWWIIHRPGSAFPKLPINEGKTNTRVIMTTAHKQLVNWKKKNQD